MRSLLQHPYIRLMRLHQPAGIWLLLWPCWWSLALCGEMRPQLYLLFAIGAVVMRAGGCIINDLWDRKLDAHVARTKDRPLASGALSVRQALHLLLVLIAIAALIALLLGWKVMAWSVASLPLVVCYPLMKRITWWPQLFLGLTFNWGALLGSVAACGEVTGAALLLYVGGIFWTLGYDTIYAHQDTADDARIGVKSTALKLGARSTYFVGVFYAIFAACFLLAAQPAGWSLLWNGGMVAQLIWQIVTVQLNSPASCKKTFASNTRMGWLAMASIAAKYI